MVDKVDYVELGLVCAGVCEALNWEFDDQKLVW